jgi:hypothetical protein
MSGIYTVLAMVASFALMMLGLVPLFRMAHKRMDQIVSGVVDGLPVSTKYRFLMLTFDFAGYVLLGASLLIVFAAGFYQVSNMGGTAELSTFGKLCSYVCIGLLGASLLFTSYLFFYMLSLVREAYEDSP